MAGLSASGLKTQIRSYTETDSNVLSDSVLENIILNAQYRIFRDVPIDADRKQQLGNFVAGQESINAPAGCVFVRGIQVYDTNGSAITTWTASHLPNTAVYVKSGKYSLGTYTTNGSGQITLTEAVTSVEIGLNFTPTIQTLPPEFQLDDGISVGQKRRIVRAVLDLNETLSVKAKNTNVLIRSVTEDFSNEPTALTTRKEIYFLGWSKDGKVTITQDQPLPLGINGILLEVEI